MSLTVTSDVEGDLQFSSRAPFHGSVCNLFDVRIWCVLIDIHKFTMDLMTIPVKDQITTREWALRGRYSNEFFRHYFLAFVSILWMIDPPSYSKSTYCHQQSEVFVQSIVNM
ncbi:hypothetical protein Plhal304r1_c036g0111121 [Plasmopara halstedii]